ncbi:MAG: hypothetical protein GXX90_02740 [Microbacteriaceae bacterium]|nr:hypothetical protein [Microbacteriaceae bacterium]
MDGTGSSDRPARGGGSMRAAAVLAGMLVAGVVGGAAVLDDSPRFRSWLERLGRRRTGERAPAEIGAAAEIDPGVLAASLEIMAADAAEILRDAHSRSRFLMTMIGVGLAVEQLRARGAAGVDAERRRLLDSAIAALSTDRAIGIANRILVDDDAPIDRASRALIVRLYGGGDRVDRRYRPIEAERVAALLRLPDDPIPHPDRR